MYKKLSTIEKKVAEEKADKAFIVTSRGYGEVKISISQIT